MTRCLPRPTLSYGYRHILTESSFKVFIVSSLQFQIFMIVEPQLTIFKQVACVPLATRAEDEEHNLIRSVHTIYPILLYQVLRSCKTRLFATTTTPTTTAQAKQTVRKVAEAFKDTGKIGKEFTTKGAIGGTAQKVGGPFAADGVIGKEFTTQGSVGGTAQTLAEEAAANPEKPINEAKRKADEAARKHL